MLSVVFVLSSRQFTIFGALSTDHSVYNTVILQSYLWLLLISQRPVLSEYEQTTVTTEWIVQAEKRRNMENGNKTHKERPQMTRGGLHDKSLHPNPKISKENTSFAHVKRHPIGSVFFSSSGVLLSVLAVLSCGVF